MGRWDVQRGWVDRLDWATRRTLQGDTTVGGTLIDAPTASAIVDLALRVSELALSVGASTADATAFALTVAQAYDLPLDVDVTWTSITASYHRSGKWEPITGFRSVRDRDNDYQMLARLSVFVDQVADGELTLVEARDRFGVLRRATRPYRAWVIALANGGLGMTVATMLGGFGLETLFAGLAMVVLFMVQRGLCRTGVAPFYQQIAGAAVPTIFALVIMQLRATMGWFADVSPSLIVAAGMVSLLAGLGVVTAARDALEGNLITSAARTFDTVLKTGGIVFGVVATLWVGQRLGAQGSISPTGAYVVPSLWQVLLGGLASIMFAFICHVSPRSLLACGLFGALGYGAFFYTMPVFDYYPAAATVGAFVVGVLAQLFSRVWRVPTLALITTGVVSLMPGMMLYRGLYYLINNANDATTVQAPGLLLDATLTGIGLAAGSMLGAQLVRPFLPDKAWRWRVAED